jgi:N-acetylneuraminic acid mutarotase
MVGAWASGAALPSGRESLSSVAYNGYLYAIAGVDGSGALSDVQMTPLSPDGATGAWSATTALPIPRWNHASVAYNGYLYVLGGRNSVWFDDVWLSKIGADGTLGPWSSTSAFNVVRDAHASVACNGHLYVLGGWGGGVSRNDVQVAKINADGTLGAWAPTTPFANGRVFLAAVAYNGSIYVVGGDVNGAMYHFNDVQVAGANSDGTLGPWSSTTAFPTARYAHRAVAANGYLYVLGGWAAHELQDVWVAPINADGTVGSWTSTTAFPTSRFEFASSIYDGFLYVLGGRDSPGARFNDVQVAPVLAPAAKGTYSKLFDLGATTRLDSITLEGLDENRGTVSLEYRVAPPSGVLGASLDKGVVPLGAPIGLGDADVRYLWVKLTLDDADTAAINPDAVNERDVTDLTVAFGDAGVNPRAYRVTCGCGSSDGRAMIATTLLLRLLRRRRSGGSTVRRSPIAPVS